MRFAMAQSSPTAGGFSGRAARMLSKTLQSVPVKDRPTGGIKGCGSDRDTAAIVVAWRPTSAR